MTTLRTEADPAESRARLAEEKKLKYEQDILTNDQGIVSIQSRLSLLEAELAKAEAKLGELKRDDHDPGTSISDSMQRKVQLLEDELDAAEKNVKDTVEK